MSNNLAETKTSYKKINKKMIRIVPLDCFKVFLSIIVIACHMFPFFGEGTFESWLLLNGLARLVVPCFFFITGYYLGSKIYNSEAMKKTLFHLILIYLVWSIIYLAPYLHTFGMEAVLGYLAIGYYHLWYMPAIILALILFFFLKKYVKNTTYILVLSLVFYVIGYLCEHLANHPGWFRNGLFIGLPFVAIGYFAKEKNLVQKAKDIHLIPIIIIGIVFLVLDSYRSYTVSFFRDIYLAQMLICPSVLLLILKHSKPTTTDNLVISNLSSLSASIYFVHYLVIRDMSTLAAEYNVFKFATVVFICLWLSIIILFINKRVRIFL